MERFYFTTGSRDDAEGLTAYFSKCDEGGNFCAGQHNQLSLQAELNGTQISAQDYVKGFYKGTLISEEEYIALRQEMDSQESLKGHYGVVSDAGRSAYIAENELQAELIFLYNLVNLESLILDVEYVYSALGATAEEIDRAFYARGMSETQVDYVLNYPNASEAIASAKARIDEIKSSI